MPAPTKMGVPQHPPDGHVAPDGRIPDGERAGKSGRAPRTTSRKFYRSSASSPAEQKRRQAWGREWGAIIRAEAEKITRGTR